MARTPFALFSSSLFVVIAAPVLAGDVYECKFTDKFSNMGYLPLEAYVDHEPGSPTALVADPIIQSEIGGPLDAKVLSDSDTKLSMSWDVVVQSSTFQTATIHYRLTIRDGGAKAKVTGEVVGYVNTFFADGSCKKKG